MSFHANLIPVCVITGFLGAGKSTLLNRLLASGQLPDTAVIINEFGDVSIDHLLVEKSGDSIIQLSDGCLCCTVRGELTETIAGLIDQLQTGKIASIQRIIIETTGLADPAPVLQAIMGNPVLAQNVRLDGVITLVDAVNGSATLDNHLEAVKQVAVADRLVLSKVTLADPAALEALKARLMNLNPRAPLIDADSAEASGASLVQAGLYDPSSKIADVNTWLMDEAGKHHHHHHHHHDVNRHDASIRSFSILHDGLIDPMALDMFVDLLRSAHGDKLLRMKAIVGLTDRPDKPVVLHGVQSIFHAPVRLPAWPDPSDRRTRMVLITKDLAEDFVSDLFDAFTGKPRIDRPDRQALESNPLSVAGFKF